jgi:lipid-binding SYLF domain-containing protein
MGVILKTLNFLSLIEKEKIMKICKIGLCALFFAIILLGCATTKGKTPPDKRHAILDMKKNTLAELYRVRPQAKSQISKAAGYAVFSDVNINVIFASFGGGYGVVKNNKTGKHTYMKMGEVGIGLGLGVKDFRAIFIFHDHHTMNKFIESGWEFGGHADAAAKASDKGAAVGGEILLDNITIYQLTESGLALQATIKGTKYWKDEALN